MNIEIAKLVKGSETKAGDGITGALRCVIIPPDGNKRAAVLKRGPIEQVTAEAFCALLLRAWNLPVPEPFLVEEANGTISFASSDMEYPNLKRTLGVGATDASTPKEVMDLARTIVSRLSSTPLAVACDEAIDNRDRNLGNILWDGQSEAWIDHAFSLGTRPDLAEVNKLCILLGALPAQEDICRSASAQSMLVDRKMPDEVEHALVSSPLKIGGQAQFVANRVTNLTTRIVARFPQPSDLFSSAK